MNVKIVSMCAALFATLVCSATTEWHVYSDTRDGLSGTQQLTNAFKRAQSGDTITIHEGTYNVPTEEMTYRYETDANGTLHATDGTCLDSSVTDLTVRGDPEASRESIVLNGQGAATASQDGQHAIMRLSGKNCTVRHLTFYKGRANSNYYVYRGGKQQNTDKWVYRRGGGLCLGDASCVCEDCVFDGCYAGQGACIYGGGEARGCVFKNSNAVESNSGCAVCSVNAVYDSLFDSNARGSLRGCSVTASNCVFVANWHSGSSGLLLHHTGGLVDCVFSNNTSVCVYMHGDKYMPKEITRCVFWNNSDSTYAAGIGGTVPCTVPVKDCTFVGSLPVSNVTAKISGCKFRTGNSKGILADCSNVADCDFDGCDGVGGTRLEGNGTTDSIAAFSNCNLERCTIHEVNIRHGALFRNVHLMKDCLVIGSTTWGSASAGGFLLTDGMNVEVVNCTFTTNSMSSGVYANTSTGTLKLQNCLFYNNNVSGKGYRQRDWIEPDGLVYMDHCFFKAPGDWSEYGVTATSVAKWDGGGSLNFYGDWSTAPRFMKDERTGAGAPPYAIHRKSLCIGKGAVQDWMSTATDLAGNPRLRDGKVDIGCYENWDPVPGMMLLLR